MLNNKYDFAVIFTVKDANPNGDPLNGNRPRETYDGRGEVSDVCIKRKLRNRLLDMGQSVFVQSDDYRADEFRSLKDRADANEAMKAACKKKDSAAAAQIACKEWIDVRSFGQVFAFKGDDVSIGVRGPVSVQCAFSVDPVDSVSMQITKSVNSVTGEKKSSDTMGMKHKVSFGCYMFCGSINCQLAEKTGFDDADAELIKKALVTLFTNDASSARPEGSMEVARVYWWKHNCRSGQYSSAKVHRSLKVSKKEGVEFPQSIDDYDIVCEELPGLAPEVYEEADARLAPYPERA